MPDIAIYNGRIVRDLMQALAAGESGLFQVPLLIKRILKDDQWSRFTIEDTGLPFKHKRFIDFVTAKPLEGLGTDMNMLRSICRDDKVAFDLLDIAEQGKHGGDHTSEQSKNDNGNLALFTQEMNASALSASSAKIGLIYISVC